MSSLRRSFIIQCLGLQWRLKSTVRQKQNNLVLCWILPGLVRNGARGWCCYTRRTLDNCKEKNKTNNAPVSRLNPSAWRWPTVTCLILNHHPYDQARKPSPSQSLGLPFSPIPVLLMLTLGSFFFFSKRMDFYCSLISTVAADQTKQDTNQIRKPKCFCYVLAAQTRVLIGAVGPSDKRRCSSMFSISQFVKRSSIEMTSFSQYADMEEVMCRVGVFVTKGPNSLGLFLMDQTEFCTTQLYFCLTHNTVHVYTGTIR